MSKISLLMTMHMLIGSIVVLSGAMALLLSKGSVQHKLAGRFFVGSIVLMGPIVIAGAWFSPGSISSLGIIFLFFMIYLVASAWFTVYRSGTRIGFMDMLAPIAALCISIVFLVMGYETVSNPSGAEGLPPNEAYFFFSALAFIAMLLDANNLRSLGVRGKHRIARHAWRMSCALFFATASLFTGPGAIVFPESMRGNFLLSVPQILVVAISAYLIYRLLFLKQRFLSKNKTLTQQYDNSNNVKN
jgi:hypothetical protein